MRETILNQEIENPILLINNTPKEIIFFYSGIFKFAKQYKLIFLPLIFSILIQVFYLGSLPLILRKMLDNVLPSKNIHLLITLLSLIGAFFIASTIGALSQSLLATKISAKLIYYLRIQIFRKTNDLPKKQLSKAEESESCRRFLGDVNSIDGQPMYAVFDSIKHLGLIFVATALLFYLEWHMAVLSVVMMRLFFGLTKFFSKKADLALKKKKQDADLLLGMIQETVLMRVAIYLLQLRSVRTNSFNKNAELACESGGKFNLNIRLVTDSTVIAINSTILLMLCIGVYFVMNDFITIGILLGFMNLLLSMSNAIASLATLTPMLIKAANAFKEIKKFTQDTNTYKDKSNQIVSMPPGKQLSGEICFEKISFNYSNNADASKNQLNGINFQIASKQFIGIVGTSGCGKSTLLKLLLGEYSASTGRIALDGYDINELDSQFLLSQFGVVMQDTMLFDTSIYDNIRLGKLDATEEEIIAAAKLAELHDTIISFPTGYQENPLGKFSLGQEQRLAIARALVRNPAILCLDEATSALVPITEAAVCKTIQAFAKNHTTIFITHRLRSMIDVDCVFVMDHGELVEQGTHQYLMKKQGFYYQLWEKQNGITIDAEGRSARIKPEWLKKIPLFSSLSKNELKEFSNEFMLERYNAGKVVFNEGDYGDKFYLIAAGIVAVLHDEKLLANLEDGDFFGEIALLADVPRTAKIVAQTDCTFLILHHQKFKKMFNNLPEAVQTLIKEKAAERRQNNK